MGLCNGSANQILEEQTARSRKIDAELQKEWVKDRQWRKLLIIPTGESDAMALLKQMIQPYEKEIDDNERKTFISTIHCSIIASIKALVKEVGAVLSKNEDARQMATGLNWDTGIDSQQAKQLANLWQDPAIQKAYDCKSTHERQYTTKYFLDQVVKICDPNYLPSNQDIKCVRVRLPGIVETDFEIKQDKFKMINVGGQLRNEKKKWIHCFENVNAVFFVAAISQYDQVLFEDRSVNQLQEIVRQFGEICEAIRHFPHASIILLLNKTDIFEHKIKKIPLTVAFPDYAGPNGDCEAAMKYLKQVFLSQRVSENHRQHILVHFVCQTDASLLHHVVNNVTEFIALTVSLRHDG